MASLVWLVLGAAMFGAGLGGGGYGAYSTRPAPLLSRTDCNRIADDEGARACVGVAQAARQRRVMLHEAEARRSVVAGSIIVGPPLAGMVLVWGIGKATAGRAPQPPRPGFPARR
jgi:hypothetical protein